MCTIERNGESELEQKLPTPASWDNGIKTDVVVVIIQKSTWKQKCSCFILVLSVCINFHLTHIVELLLFISMISGVQ